MAAVIRLKRRLEDEPPNALILNCKKRKTDSSSEGEGHELSTVLKFVGTVDSQEDALTHLKKPTKVELEEHFKKHNTDLITKLRLQKQQESKNNRYKVVNCFRSQEAKSELDDDKELTVYDLETESHVDKEANDARYVYDLYYTASDDLGDAYLEDYVNMYPYSDDLIYGSMRDNGLNQLGSDDDSEDSNAESNWKNDYPDEDDLESVTEEDMVNAMRQCDLSDLSSDGGEEGFVYSVDSKSLGFEEGIADSDVQRYGERYAKFKARHGSEVQTSDLNNDLYYGDIDENEYYY